MAEVVDQIEEVRNTLRKISQLRDEIPVLRKAVARLRDAEEEWRVLAKALNKQMEELDLAHSGNYGHEGRRLHFLIDLVFPTPTLEA